VGENVCIPTGKRPDLATQADPGVVSCLPASLSPELAFSPLSTGQTGQRRRRCDSSSVLARVYAGNMARHGDFSVAGGPSTSQRTRAGAAATATACAGVFDIDHRSGSGGERQRDEQLGQSGLRAKVTALDQSPPGRPRQRPVRCRGYSRT
jgi:hypothetical protein